MNFPKNVSRALVVVFTFLIYLTSIDRSLAQESYIPPLSSYIDTSEVPLGDFFEPGEGETREGLMSRIRAKDFNYTEINEGGEDIGATVTGILHFLPAVDGTKGLAFGIPGIDDFELITGTGDINFSVTARETESTDPAADYPAIITLSAIDLGIRVKGKFLRPVLQLGSQYTPYEYDEGLGQFIDGNSNPVMTEFTTNTDLVLRLTWDGEVEVEFGTGGNVASFNSSTPFMLADTGIVLNVRGASLDLSSASSPAGAPSADWKGLTFDALTAAFTGDFETPELDSDNANNPPDFASIQLSNFAIGTGGFRGSITGNFGSGGQTDLGGMDFKMQSIGVVFEQNALIGASIGGRIDSFPFFEKPVKLDLGFDMDGNFKAGIAVDDPSRDGTSGLVSWDIDGVVEMELDSIDFALQDKEFYTTINGGIVLDFLNSDPDVDMESGQDTRVPVNNLRIGSDGKVSLEGGWVTLPEKHYLDFNAFKVEIAQIGFGLEDQNRWAGFSGGVELVKGMSTNAKFKQLNFSWPKGGGAVKTKLQGVEVAFEKPEVLSFHGAADWFEDNNQKGFAGKLSANLEFIDMTMSSRVVIGQTLPGAAPPSYGTCDLPDPSDPFKFFYLDIDADLGAGTPIFSGISLYGLSGLLALNMEPNLCAYDKPLDWFRDHISSTNVVSGTPPPWSPNSDAFAVGVGAIIGTTPDAGYTVNSKVALTVAVPGPVVILSGQGNVLKKRGELLGTTDPTFLALAIYDGKNPSFLLNLGVYFKIPSNGSLVDLSAESEAFFNLRDPSDWHFYMGKRSPEDERINVTALSFLTASAYYMIDPDSFAFGTKAGYDSRPKYKFGPLKVQLAAWVGFDAELSWRPRHIWGQADMGGLVDLSAFGVGVGMSANALLEVSSPTPYFIDGTFKAKLNLPWPLPDPEADVHMRWEKQKDPEPVDEIVKSMGLEASKSPETTNIRVTRNTTVSSGHQIPTSQFCSPFDSLSASTCSDAPLVPVTYRPTVGFERSINENLPVTGSPKLEGNVNGHQDAIGNTSFSYELTKLDLWAEPISAGSVQTFQSILPEVYGSWPPYLGNPGRPAALSVKLWNKNPFSYFDHSSYLRVDENGDPETWVDWVTEAYPTWPCPPPDSPTNPKDPRNEEGSSDGEENAGNQDRRVREFQAPPVINPEETSDDCFDVSALEAKDLILPPYHAFAMASGSHVNKGNTVLKSYHDVSYFYTQGPPLALDPFVHHTIPASLNYRHYRSYQLGLRFNETYMDLLYREPGSPQDLLYKDPGQKLVFEIVDENGEATRGSDGNPVIVTTEWAEAVGQFQSRNDEALIETLNSQGINSGVRPNDDIVRGWPAYADALRPSIRYSARVWYEDPRLASDRRILDPDWLAKHKVRQIDSSNNRVLLFEYPFIASIYESFSDIAKDFDGLWFKLSSTGFDAAQLQSVLSSGWQTQNSPSQFMNTDYEYVAWYLTFARPDISEDSLTNDVLRDVLSKHTLYADDPLLLDDEDIGQIKSKWRAERSKFVRAIAAAGVDRSTEPFPTQAEVSVIMAGSSQSKAILLELPESLEIQRISIALEHQPAGLNGFINAPVKWVSDPLGQRILLVKSNGSNWNDGDYKLSLSYARNVGAHEPRLIRTDPNTGQDDGQLQEVAIFNLSLPDGQFIPEDVQ